MAERAKFVRYYEVLAFFSQDRDVGTGECLAGQSEGGLGCDGVVGSGEVKEEFGVLVLLVGGEDILDSVASTEVDCLEGATGAQDSAGDNESEDETYNNSHSGFFFDFHLVRILA